MMRVRVDNEINCAAARALPSLLALYTMFTD